MSLYCMYSQLLLKQITEVEGSGGGGSKGRLDSSLRENLSLFRLTADAMVQVWLAESTVLYQL